MGEGMRVVPPLDPGRDLVVLMSGGRDSVCLLHLAAEACGAERVRTLHVNYGLRPGSDGDERLCAEHCGRLGVALEVVRAGRGQARGNVQAWARGLRYAAAARLAEPLAALVATAHTASDQAETVLYRLASSPGRRALLGMHADSALPVPGSAVRLVRPLLSYTREETTAYCRERGLRWRDDPSNESDAYARGRVRGRLVPALGAVHPGAERNVVRTAELLREEAQVLDEVVDATLDGDRIELARLRALSPALRRLVVRHLAEKAAAGYVPGLDARVEDVLALGESGTARLDVGGGVRALAEYGVLRFVAAPPERAPDPVVLPVPGAATFGPWTLACEPAAPAARAGFLDREALGDEVVVRPWRAGDRVAPLGLGGTKTVGDLFTARRVPLEERATVPVVEARGEVAWIPGVATGERFRVTGATRAAVRFRAHRS
ncbi:MAG: tRNA(Ile)-lysidine synthase [Solirubrobacteraceae bacterium]|jgi:tRNA(Ile)-lysidine synthase|nr:tRNA(Ile)-lysidine synthase [Solirubrobacteraceae bacterium]